jgi:predicted dehydrogenase
MLKLFPPLRFVIVGCGRMGRVHLERLRADGRGHVVALFDADSNAMTALQRNLAPDARCSASLEELVTRTDADAAIICTPTPLHFEQVRACRARGWHVLCEKPLADRRDHLLTLIEESHRGPLLSVAYQRRYWPIYRVLRDEIQSGRWGAVKSITSINSERWQPTINGTWRDDPAINRGGFLGDAGSHKIDLIFFLTGLQPIEVFARHLNCGSRVQIVSSVSARLEGDVPLTMQFTGNAQTFHEELHIHCERADLLLRDWRLWLGRDNRLEPLPITNPRWQAVMGLSPLTHPELDRLGNPVRGFLDQLLLGSEAVAPADCALPVFDFTQAALRSGASDQTGFLSSILT